MLNSELNISWDGESGTSYRILKTTNLTLQSWYLHGDLILENDGPVSVEIPMTNNVEFIRVEVDQ